MSPNPYIWLNTLASEGFRLWMQNGEVRYKGPRRILTSELTAELKQRKADIVRVLQMPEWWLAQIKNADTSERLLEIRDDFKSVSELRHKFPMLEEACDQRFRYFREQLEADRHG